MSAFKQAYVERSADAETEHDPGAEPRRGRHRGGQKSDRLRLGGVDVFFVHLAVLVDVQHDSRRFTHHSFEIFPLHVDDVVELEPSEEGVDGGEDHDGELGDGLTEDPNAEADDAGDAKLGAEELGEFGEVDLVEEVLRFVLSALLTPRQSIGQSSSQSSPDPPPEPPEPPEPPPDPLLLLKLPPPPLPKQVAGATRLAARLATTEGLAATRPGSEREEMENAFIL